MNFMRIGSVVDNYIVQSRLDSGKRPWRQVYLTFRWENGECDGRLRLCAHSRSGEIR